MRLLPKVRGYRYAMMHRCATPIIPGIDAIAFTDLRDDDAIMHRSLEIIERGDIIHVLHNVWRMFDAAHTRGWLGIVYWLGAV